MEKISGRVAFVTGAAQGIGFGIAAALARAGCRVALADIDGDGVEQAADRIAALAGGEDQVAALGLDVQDRAAFGRVVDEAEALLGPVEILCNNAGLGSTGSIADLTFAVWDRVLGINLGGVVNGVQTVLPRMLDRNGPGHIVNVASGAGLVATQYVTYVTSKFAVVGLTESLRLQPELAAAGIGVTVVCPGLVRTSVLHNSARYVPSESAVNDEGHALLQKYGLDPAIVGEQVLAAVRENRLYVHTDRYIEPLLAERCRALVAALPEETERDRELAALLRARTAARPAENG